MSSGSLPANHPTGQGLVLITLCLGAFMATLDAAIVTIALPNIAVYFNSSLGEISWVMVIYLLALVSLLMTGSQLGDIWAPGGLYLFGLVLFSWASILCGLSQELGWLVASRALQGAGAALMLGLAPKILAETFDEVKWGIALGFLSTAHAVGFTIGAPLGGIITAYWGWPYIFFLNVPLCTLALLLGSRSLLRLPAQKVRALRRFDLSGSFLLAGSLGFFLSAITAVRASEWLEPRILRDLALSAGLFALLLFRERRQSIPLLHRELWRNWPFVAGALTELLTFAAFNGTFFLIPFYLQQIFHYPLAKVGLLLAVLSIADAVAAPCGGYLAKRYSNLLILRLGSGLILLGLLSLLLTTPETSTFHLARRFFVVGLGLGLFQAPNLNEILHGVKPSLFGLAASTNLVLKNLGAAIGITLIILAFAFVNQHHVCLRAGFCYGIAIYRNAFLVTILLAALSFLINLIFRKPRLRTPRLPTISPDPREEGIF